MDPVDETEAEISSGLEFPEMEPRKLEVCRGKEPRRSNMIPECEDKLKVSLQPVKICSPLSDQYGSNEIFAFGEFFKASKVAHRRFSAGMMTER